MQSKVKKQLVDVGPLDFYNQVAMVTTITSKPLTAEQVARYMIKLSHDETKKLEGEAGSDPHKKEISFDEITPLKLQKLLYFAQAASLAVNKKPLFEDEIQAWHLGPAVYSIYKKFEKYGGLPLPQSEASDEGISQETASFLTEVWKEFGKFSAKELVEITHRHKPWKEAFNPKEPHQTIEIKAIKEFYTPLFAPRTDEQKTLA